MTQSQVADSRGFAINFRNSTKWTDTTRALHARGDLALPSDLTDTEWAVLEPLPPSAHQVGRPRKWPLRRMVEAILYLIHGGLPWRMLPPCFPPVSTVRRWFYLWRYNGLSLSLNQALLLIGREAAEREVSPSAGVIDSQSVKTTESGGPRGYDAGNKIKGRKRHILTDTEGNLVQFAIHTADIQDRDGAPLALTEIIRRFSWLRHLFAGAGYACGKVRDALRRIGKWTVEIVKPSDAAKGFVVLPRRWMVERTLAWLSRNRRLAKDFEHTIASATAWLFIASI